MISPPALNLPPVPPPPPMPTPMTPPTSTRPRANSNQLTPTILGALRPPTTQQTGPNTLLGQ